MNLARILPRFSVRRLMIVVAIVAVGIGGTLEYWRLRECSRQYTEKALIATRQASWYRRGASMSQEEWLTGREEVDRYNREQSWYKAAYFPDPETCRRRFSYYEATRLIYERAAPLPIPARRTEPTLDALME